MKRKRVFASFGALQKNDLPAKLAEQILNGTKEKMILLFYSSHLVVFSFQ